MYKTQKDKHLAIVADLKAVRIPHEPLWEDIDQNVAPGMYRPQLSDTGRGTREDHQIINSTGDKCFETFQNGMIAYGTNPSEPWIEIAPEDPGMAKYGPTATFCEDVAKELLAVTEDAGVYEDFKGVFGYGGKFANGLMWMEENLKRVVHTQTMALGQWWIGKDHVGEPNVFYREIQMTVRQVVEKFCGDPRKPDWSKVSLRVKSEWDAGRYQTPIDVGHIVLPNEDYNPRAMVSSERAFKSCYYELGGIDGGHLDREKYLRESGYDEFPALHFPWDIYGDDVYGMGCPGMMALGDTKELQHWAMKTAEAVDKMVNPPLMGHAGLKMNKVGYFPGQITYVNDTDIQRGGFRPLHEIQPKVLEANDRETRIEARIKDAWHMNAFRYLDAIDHSKRTATEIAARQQQAMLELVGPMNRINKGILNPYIERLFSYMVQQGKIGGPFGIEIPRELEGQKLKIRYVSRMAQAMRSVGLGSIDRVLETAIVLGNVYKAAPTIFNFMNAYQTLSAVAKGSGAPARMIRSEEEVAQIEQAQAQAQAMQAQAEMIERGTVAAKNLASAPTGEKNALTDVVGALEEAA